MKDRRTSRNALFLGLGITLFVLILRLASIGEGGSLRSLDFLFSFRRPIPVQSPIVIVAIDNESFNEMPERWIWPRNFHARLIRNIMKGKPKVIAFDVLFTEESREKAQQDADLAAACRAAGCVIMGSEIITVRDKNYQYEELKLPIQALRKAIYSTGVVNTPKDPDAFVRRSKLMWKVHDETQFSLGMEALRKYLSVGQGEISADAGVIEFGERKIPVDSGNNLLVNFCGPAKTFTTIPYYQVYEGGKGFNPGIFKDAIVFVGATAEDLHDTFPAPFTWDPLAPPEEQLNLPMPGVEIHCNAVETILTGNYISESSMILNVFLVVLFGALVSWVTIRYRMLVALLVTLGTAVGLILVSVWLFLSYRQFMEFIHPLYAIMFSFVGCTVYRASVEMREKQRVRATFARYVSPHVLTTVLNKTPELGGQRRVATILFSDVRGFTSMSERLSAHEVVAILNEYLTEMVDVVLKHDGTLDKFVGDAVMAVYGSPMDQPDHALRAVSTAWHMSERHNKLKEKWLNEGKVPFEIGIGVNTGEVVAGNMGSPTRMEFTVIGDNVNTASRLESATKELGAKIIISDSTYQIVKDYVTVTEKPPVRVKGKEQPVVIWELIGLKQDEVTRALRIDLIKLAGVAAAVGAKAGAAVAGAAAAGAGAAAGTVTGIFRKKKRG